MFEEYLKHRPHDDVERGRFAVLCAQANHYPEALEHFKLVGDRLAPWPREPNLPLDSMKRLRDRAAFAVTGKPFQVDTAGPEKDGEAQP